MAEPRMKFYPDSRVELTPFIARHYDLLVDLLSGGSYRRFIARAINDLDLQPDDSVLDLGCGSGRNAALMLEHLGPGGRITGLDLSPEMKEQFINRFAGELRAAFHQQRIDVPFNLEQKFDLAFISFVLHGFPQEVRGIILENVVRHLKPGGRLAILDYAEFNLSDKPFIFRWVFKKFECAYARDFIEFDWKKILKEVGFQIEEEKFYFRNYLRLLKARLLGL